MQSLPLSSAWPPAALTKDELVMWFDRIENHFEAINGGRHITFEHVVQPKPHPLVSATEPGPPCDICASPQSRFTCSYRDCPARMWVCARCVPVAGSEEELM